MIRSRKDFVMETFFHRKLTCYSLKKDARKSSDDDGLLQKLSNIKHEH